MDLFDFAFNFIGQYTNPQHKIIAARSALAKTRYGLNNIIRADLQDDNVVYILNATGQTFATSGQAIAEAAKYNISETITVSPTAAGNKVSGLAEMVRNINTEVSRLDPSQIAMLKRAGIDVDNLSKLDLTVSTLRAEKGGAKKVAEQLLEMNKRGESLGLATMDDSGARVLSFSIDGKILNAEQSHLLLASSGHSLMNKDFFSRILGTGDENKLASNLLKIGKRQRSLASERLISLAGDELSKFLGKGKGSLVDNVLIVDNEFNLLKKYAYETVNGKDSYNFGGDKALQAYYKGKNPLDYFGTYVESLTDKENKVLSDLINSYNGPNNFKDLEAFIESSLPKTGTGSKQNAKILKAFKSSASSVEYAYDGADLLNKRYYSSYISKINSELSALEKVISSPGISTEAKNEAANQISNLRSLLAQVSDANLEDIVGRGHIAGVGDIKTAFKITNEFFDNPELRKYAAILSTHALKKESGFAGNVDQLLLAGFGHPRDLVYLDPVASAMHGQIFNDPDTVEAIRRRGFTKIEEFRGAIEQGVLPEKMRKMLERTAALEIGDLPIERKASSIRAKEYAAKILQMHQSGISPRQAPSMLNMIAQVYATEIYREKDGILQTVLPETYRFSLSSEAHLPGESKLGRGFTKLRSTYEDLQGNRQILDADVLNFRVKGHTMYFGSEAIGQTRHVLGGFDLDDKGIAKLFRYTDDKGMARIAFHLIRQPTSIDETMVGRALMDEDTVRAIANNEYFMKAMENILEQQGPKAPRAIVDINRIITEGITVEEAFSDMYTRIDKRYQQGKITLEQRNEILSRRQQKVQSKIEGAIDAVYQQMEQMGFTKTSTLSNEAMQRAAAAGSQKGLIPLRVMDISKEPEFARQGIFKLMQKNDAFSLSEDMLSIINNSTLTAQQKAAFQGAKTTSELMLLLEKNIDNPQVMAAFNQAYANKTIKAMAEGGDVLGVYVNRTMVVGSIMDQYEKMLESVMAGSNEAFKDLMKDFKIGLVSSEGAIDAAVNPMGIKKLVETAKVMRESLEYSTNLGMLHNEKGVQKTLNELLNLTDQGIGSIGDQMIAGVGKLIGATRVSGAVDDKLQIGLDEILLRLKDSGSARISDQDIRILLAGIASGMEESAAVLGQDVSAQLKEIETARVHYDDEQARRFLEQIFALRQADQEEFMSMSKNVRVAEELRGYLEATTRSMRGNIDNSIIKNAEVTERSNAVARQILERNRESLDFIFERAQKDAYGNLLEQSDDIIGQKQALGRNILAQIDQASKLQGVSMETLINSIDAMTIGSRDRVMRTFDVSQLEDVIQTAEMGFDRPEQMTVSRIFQARALRTAKNYQKFSQEIADDLMSRVSGNTLAEIENSVKNILKTEANLDDYAKTVYQSFLGELPDATPADIREQIILDAQIFRSRVIEEVNAQNFQQIMTTGSIADAEEAAKHFGDEFQLSDDFIASLDDSDNFAVNKQATYKRFTDAIKDGDIKKLFTEPLIKRGTLAIGALILGSFAYSAHRDRTHDDMAGPPLLPGGSAYELDYPTRIPEIANFRGIGGYNPGVSYSVSVNGGQDEVELFNEQASGLINGGMSTTIYNRIPNAGQDPYASIASSY